MVGNQSLPFSQDNLLDQLQSTQEGAKFKGTRLGIYVVVFTIFLSLGIWSGRIAGKFTSTKGPMATLSAMSPPPTPSNGQTNLLVIGVDRLNIQKPRLESIWLLGYFSNNPHFSFIPVYPSQNLGNNHDMEIAFELTADGRPNSELVNLLQKKRIWWNGTVIIDEIGMIEIIDFLNGVEVQGHLLKGALAVGSSPLPWEDPAAALKGQTQILQSSCHQTNLLSPSADLRNILNLIPDHLRTDIDIFQAIRDWRELVNGEQKLVCDFPLLNASLP